MLHSYDVSFTHAKGEADFALVTLKRADLFYETAPTPHDCHPLVCSSSCKIHNTLKNIAFPKPFQWLKINSKWELAESNLHSLYFVGNSSVEVVFEQLVLGSGYF